MNDKSEVNAVCKTVVASFIIKNNKSATGNRKKLFSYYEIIHIPFRNRTAIFDFSQFRILF